MGRERADGQQSRAVEQNSDSHVSHEERILVYSNGSLPVSNFGQTARRICDTEIAQLVSVALEDAIAALDEPLPEIYLRLRACEARAGIREMLSASPGEKPKHSKMLLEYRRAIMFQTVALELSLEIVAGIRRYSKVCERDIQAKFR